MVTLKLRKKPELFTILP